MLTNHSATHMAPPERRLKRQIRCEVGSHRCTSGSCEKCVASVDRLIISPTQIARLRATATAGSKAAYVEKSSHSSTRMETFSKEEQLVVRRSPFSVLRCPQSIFVYFLSSVVRCPLSVVCCRRLPFVVGCHTSGRVVQFPEEAVRFSGKGVRIKEKGVHRRNLLRSSQSVFLLENGVQVIELPLIF